MTAVSTPPTTTGAGGRSPLRRPVLLVALAPLLALAACGDGDDAAGPRELAEEVGEQTGASGVADAAADEFCEAVLVLETAFPEERAELSEVLEAATPAGLEDEVATVREYADRQAAGEDVFADADFTTEYDNAVKALREDCGS